MVDAGPSGTKITVSIKPYKDDGYLVLQTPITTASGTSTDNYMGVQSLTSSSFVITVWATIAKRWYTAGYSE